MNKTLGFFFLSAILAIGTLLGISLIRKKKCTLPEIISLKHLGIIMDGNRRWAKKSGLATWLGHKKGVDPVKVSIQFCLDHAIEKLTVYAFSLENFKRPQQELDFLFNILAQEIASKELNNLLSSGVKVVFAGDRNLFPHKLVKIIHDVEEKTSHNTKLLFTILFCYGGQQEILEAVKSIGHDISKGLLSPDEITSQIFEDHLWCGGSRPDLIIRTGGMMRLSNFLPYQSAYSELYFTNRYWPEIEEEDLCKAVIEFETRARNFGK